MAALPVLFSCAGPTGAGSSTSASLNATAPFTPGNTAPEELSSVNFGSLKVSKWRLGNGLQIILAPDPSARSICYTTWFRVGSRHENAPAGETGLAHLFEHLMFTQTHGAEEGDFDRQMEAVGGSINAMTYYDFTAYIDNLPPEHLDLAARLESDRMVNLALTAQQVQTERDVVAEERLMVVEDDVDGQLDEDLFKTAFRKHPYHWPVIGWMKDIKAVTREKAVAFYRRHYAPNNAVVILSGRFDPQQALAILNTHYGAIPPAAIDEPATVNESGPVAAARIEQPHPVPADRLAIATAAPALGHPDRAAFEVLNDILTGGPSARLQRALLVDQELASSVSASASDTRDPGLFVIWIQMRKGHRAAAAEAIVSQHIADLARQPVENGELEAARNRLQTEFWLAFASSEGKAERLGLFEVAAGDYRSLFARAEQHAAVTAADVQRVARQYLVERPHVIAVAVPGAPVDNDAEADTTDDAEAL